MPPLPQDRSLPFIGTFFALGITLWVMKFIDFCLVDGSVRDSLFRAPDTVTLVSGVLFLIDLLCVLWWYAKYIYVAQPIPTLWMYLLDFCVCAAFGIAAHTWDKPLWFFGATGFASMLLLCRFVLVYRGEDATDTDKRIIWRAGVGLGVALTLVVIGALVFLALRQGQELDLLCRAMPGILSLIGIVLTGWLHYKIAVAARIRERSPLRFVPMEMQWPDALCSEQRVQGHIRREAERGLDDFSELFHVPGAKLWHDRLPSRVHAQADLAVQSCIIAVPSRNAQDSEIERKAFIVGLSHWLDDLFDGCRETAVVKALRRDGKFSFGVPANNLDPDTVQELFQRLYRREIVQHTEPRVYRALLERIVWAAPLDDNMKYVYFGLVRVGAGAVMFSPKISHTIRGRFRRSHNKALRRLVAADTAVDTAWRIEVVGLLQEIDQGLGSPGQILLSLTTKTVQELAMSSEPVAVNFPLSVLYSILYAPLLYFHDVDDEVEQREMVALDNFDVNVDCVIEWLRTARALCHDPRAHDKRSQERSQQLEMAYRCFAPKLPQFVREAMEEIYLPPKDQGGPGVFPMREVQPAPRPPAGIPGRRETRGHLGADAS